MINEDHAKKIRETRTSMIAKTVICVRCKWHIGSGDLWYNHYCGHPDVEHPLSIDPVTGKKGYAAKNDLGTTYYGGTKYPHCRNINDGMCKRWEN